VNKETERNDEEKSSNGSNAGGDQETGSSGAECDHDEDDLKPLQHRNLEGGADRDCIPSRRMFPKKS
jgi:hypothetical protein